MMARLIESASVLQFRSMKKIDDLLQAFGLSPTDIRNELMKNTPKRLLDLSKKEPSYVPRMLIVRQEDVVEFVFLGIAIREALGKESLCIEVSWYRQRYQSSAISLQSSQKGKDFDYDGKVSKELLSDYRKVCSMLPKCRNGYEIDKFMQDDIFNRRKSSAITH